MSEEITFTKEQLDRVAAEVVSEYVLNRLNCKKMMYDVVTGTEMVYEVVRRLYEHDKK